LIHKRILKKTLSKNITSNFFHNIRTEWGSLDSKKMKFFRKFVHKIVRWYLILSSRIEEDITIWKIQKNLGAFFILRIVDNCIIFSFLCKNSKKSFFKLFKYEQIFFLLIFLTFFFLFFLHKNYFAENEN
jgi:hypothetical protein